MRRTGPSSDTVYVYSGAGPLAEYAPGALPSNPNTEYIYLGGQLIASKSSGAYTFYVRDHLSVRQTLADASPNNPTELGHLPFGESWYGSGTKWRFTTYERDSTMGDDYAMMRRYQYTYGRFSSPDPIGGDPADPQTWDRYSYTADDPLNWVDPSGMNVAHPGACSWANSCPGGTDPTFSFAPSEPMTKLYFTEEGSYPLFWQNLLWSDAAPYEIASIGGAGAPNSGISNAKWNCEQDVIMGSLIHGAASALGVDGPPGSDPAGDLASAIRESARNPVVQLGVGAIAAQMGRMLSTPAVAARIGVLVSDEAVPIIGWGATAYIGYKAVSAGVSYFKSHIGSCSDL